MTRDAVLLARARAAAGLPQSGCTVGALAPWPSGPSPERRRQPMPYYLFLQAIEREAEEQAPTQYHTNQGQGASLWSPERKAR